MTSPSNTTSSAIPAAPSLLRVRDWSTHFENNKTRSISKTTWVPVPNKMDDLGYLTLVSHPDGAAHFGIWIAIVEMASRCHPRGTLVLSGGRPHDAASLALISRLPSSLFESAIPRLVEIGWLELIPSESSIGHHDGAQAPSECQPGDTPTAPKWQDGALSRARGMEWNGMEVPPSPPAGGCERAPGETIPARRSDPEPRNAEEDGGFSAIWRIALDEVWVAEARRYLGNKAEAWRVWRSLNPSPEFETLVADALHALKAAPRGGLRLWLEGRGWEGSNSQEPPALTAEAALAAAGVTA